MSDQILMDNYLLLLKSSVEVYVHGTLESSNEDVRNTLKESLDNIMTMQADTYDKMTEYDWYQVNNVEMTQIQETLNKLQSQDNNNNQDNENNEDDDYQDYEDNEEEDSEE